MAAVGHADRLSRLVERSRWSRVIVPIVLVLLLGLTTAAAALADHRLTDAHVYLGGGTAWLHGADIYTSMFPASYPNFYLPFTYPPFAAVLFGLIGWLPMPVALALLMTASLACGVIASAYFLREVFPRLVTPSVVLFVALVAMLLEPVRETVSFGQVNLILMALVTADCLTRSPRWPRGLLIGIAAAIKLTPAAFVLFFLAKGRRRPALVAFGGFVGCSMIGLIVAPADSRAYWLGALGDTDRVGQLAFATNQSIRGVLARLDLPLSPSATTTVWAMSVLLVVVSAWLVTRRLHNRGDRLGALVVVATVPLLISPVSWSHHWVWALPGLLWAATSIGRRALTVPLALVAAVFCYGPHWWYPPLALAGQRWVGWYNILGNAYVWITCALLGVLVVTTARSPERRCPRRDDEGGAGRPVVTSGTAR